MLLALVAVDGVAAAVRRPDALQLRRQQQPAARSFRPLMTAEDRYRDLYERKSMIESLVAEVSAIRDESDRKQALEEAVRSWGGLRTTLADDFAATCKDQITALQQSATERHERGEDTTDDQAQLQALVSTWIGSRVFLQRISSEDSS